MTSTLTATSLGGLTVSRVQQRSRWLNIGVYGDSGIGKTVLSGSASVVEGMAPVIHIDAEGGTESLLENFPQVETVRVKDVDEMQAVYNELYLGNHSYRTVILDSASEIQLFSMRQIMKELVEKRPDLDPDVPGMREWGKNLNQMRKIIRGFRDLEMHTIITALNMEKKDERTGQRLMQPKFTGQFAAEFPSILDVVLYYYIKEIQAENGEGTEQKRLLLSGKTDTIVAKDRTQKLPMVLQDPDMQQIYDLMFADEKPKVSTTSKAKTTEEPINI